MSWENLDVFQKGNDAFRRGDWDAIAATMDPHIVVRNGPSWPESFYYGREAVIAFNRGLWESWGPDARVEEVVDLGDRLLSRWRYIVRGQHSGVEGEQRASVISTFRNRLVILVEYFIEHEHALEALEMRE